MILSPDEDPFIVAIRENPRDFHRLIYADWLEENGSPERASYLRLAERLASRPATSDERRELFLMTSAFDPGWTRSSFWSVVLKSLRVDLHAPFLEAIEEFVTLPVEFHLDRLPASLKMTPYLREIRKFMSDLFRFLGNRFPGEKFDIVLDTEQPSMSGWREMVGVRSTLQISGYQTAIRVPILKTVLDIMQVEVAETPDFADRLPIVFPDLLREVVEFQLERLDKRIPEDLRRRGRVPDPTRPLYEYDISH